MGNVINLPNAGPPETDFEREAVETVIGAIREYRSRTGRDPLTIVGVLMETSPDFLATRMFWFTRAELASMIGPFATAAAIIDKRWKDALSRE